MIDHSSFLPLLRKGKLHFLRFVHALNPVPPGLKCDMVTHGPICERLRNRIPEARLDGKTSPKPKIDCLPLELRFSRSSHVLHEASHWVVHKEPLRYFILASEQC